MGAGADRRNDSSDNLLSFLGVLGWRYSTVTCGMRLLKPMGGGAAESKDEARDETDLSSGTSFSSPN